jgi:acyl-CoA oxidase
LLPGIIIGDCGSKIGLNNIDNGYFILEDVVVPRISLLDKLGSVD